MQYIKKIFTFITLIVKSKKKLKIKKNIDILLFNTEEGIFENILYSKNLNFAYLDTNLSEINLVILIKSFFNLNILINKFKNIYVIEFIKIHQPKLVLTFSDNNIDFYKYKKYLPNTKFSFVQNGIRSSHFDVFEKFKQNEKYEVDYMFVFNDNIGKQYNKFIKGQYIVTGSLKNNYVKLTNHNENNDIFFMSQYIHKNNINDFILISSNIDSVTHKEFYKLEEKLLSHLSEYCSKNNFNLKILGRPNKSSNYLKEYQFYSKILKNADWEYVSSENLFDSYYKINNNKMLVSIDCTLGYEALCREKKIIFFPKRSKSISDPFGWPNDLGDDGDFWSSDNSKEKFNDLMDYVINLEINDWKKIINPYKNKLLIFDENNRIFNQKILEILN